MDPGWHNNREAWLINYSFETRSIMKRVKEDAAGFWLPHHRAKLCSSIQTENDVVHSGKTQLKCEDNTLLAEASSCRGLQLSSDMLPGVGPKEGPCASSTRYWNCLMTAAHSMQDVFETSASCWGCYVQDCRRAVCLEPSKLQDCSRPAASIRRPYRSVRKRAQRAQLWF